MDEEPEFWFPKEWRGKPVNAKQGSSGIIQTPNFVDWVYSQTQEQLNLYNEMISNDVAPELARVVLPQNTMTEWIWSGSLAAFARVIKLRTDPHAQLEAQEVANLIKDKLAPVFPVALQALLEN